MTKNIFTIVFLFLSLLGNSQELKLEEIMKGESFTGRQPQNGRWSPDGKKVFFEWNPNDDPGSSTYFWEKGMVQPKLANAEESLLSKLDFKRKNDSDLVYYIKNGSLYLYKISSKTTKKLFQQSEPISNLELSTEDGVLFFLQSGNLFKYNTKEGTILQITNFKNGNKRENVSEKSNFLKDQQKELFQFIRDADARKEWYASLNKTQKTDFAKEYFYGKDDFYNLKINPNGLFATFSLVEAIEPKREKMEVFITADGYNQSPETKEKVSVSNLVNTKFGIYSVAKDSVYYVDFSKLSHLQDPPEYFKFYPQLNNKIKPDKLIVTQAPIYNENGTLAVCEIRSQDNKDRWIVSLNLEKGTFTEIDHQHDEAWIGGPGIPSYSFDDGTLGFLADNQTIYFQSEATGYSHLYTYDIKLKKKIQLTSGSWEVREVLLSKDKKTFYITTNMTHPGDRNFYKLPAAGGILEPILTKKGAHEVVVSPDEKSLLVRYSYKNKPWEYYIAENRKNTTLQQITTSVKPEFQKYKWRDPEVITFTAQDGTPVNARVYTPEVSKSNKAAIIFVHGAGYLQNAHNYWSTYHREYMFHNLLADLGYTVMDIDYRGSDGYGRDFRTGIYRFMGGKDLSDHLDGKKHLIARYGIEEGRVGIYGGSYGGFITLMAMLTTPDEFTSGAALRSVTDWAHYNHGYTGNILNFPETDPEAYKKSSPIYYAQNLKGNLLMLHGMVDDNVEYKDIVRLSQRFIELEKKNWSLASFPVEAHGFKETYSWIDEYSRILNLFNSTLLAK